MKTTPKSVDCAARLAVLADPTRLAVVEILLAGARNVTQINEKIGIAQNLLSHHLRILRDARIVVSSRAGKAARYTLAPGVEIGASRNAVNLGCCSLTFEKVRIGRNAL